MFFSAVNETIFRYESQLISDSLLPNNGSYTGIKSMVFRNYGTIEPSLCVPESHFLCRRQKAFRYASELISISMLIGMSSFIQAEKNDSPERIGTCFLSPVVPENHVFFCRKQNNLQYALELFSIPKLIASSSFYRHQKKRFPGTHRDLLSKSRSSGESHFF